MSDSPGIKPGESGEYLDAGRLEMARLTDKMFMLEYKDWQAPDTVVHNIQSLLESIPFDTYNHRYVVRITVDQLDKPDDQPKPDLTKIWDYEEP